MARKPDTRKKPGPQERARIKAAKLAEAEQAEQAAIAKAKALADAESAKRKAKHTPPATPVAKKQKAASAPVATLAKRIVKEAIDEMDDEDAVPLAKPKLTRKERQKAKLDPNKTMGKSYQRAGTVASGFAIKGGGIQLTVTVLPEQAQSLSILAAANGVSLSEQLRRVLREAKVGVTVG